jgi:hypothetical protein
MRVCPRCGYRGVIQECNPASVVNYIDNIQEHAGDVTYDYDILDTDYDYDKESFVCAECDYKYKASSIEELYFEMKEKIYD